MKLCIATHNPAKLRSYKLYLEPEIEVVSLDDLGITEEAPEDAIDLAENALSKARFYFERTHMPTLAVDGGLMINGLNGEPGARSRRWPGYVATDDELIQMAIEKTKHLAGHDRDGTFGVALCYKDQTHEKIFKAETAITIAKTRHPKMIEGWPYRSVMIVKSKNKYFLDLSESELKDIDHNSRGVQELKQYLLHL